MQAFRRRRGDEGAAAVEFALLFPIFMVLAMGIINGGIAFSRQINVTQAAREASRYGATLSVDASGPGGTGGTLATWLGKVETAATESVGNKDNPIGGFDYLCVAMISYLANGNVDTVNTGYKKFGSPAQLNSPTGCPETKKMPNLGPSSRVVQVAYVRNVQFFVLFINPKLELDAVSVTPFEAVGTT